MQNSRDQRSRLCEFERSRIMKRIALIIAVLGGMFFASTAQAHWPRYGYYGYPGYRYSYRYSYGSPYGYYYGGYPAYRYSYRYNYGPGYGYYPYTAYPSYEYQYYYWR